MARHGLRSARPSLAAPRRWRFPRRRPGGSARWSTTTMRAETGWGGRGNDARVSASFPRQRWLTSGSGISTIERGSWCRTPSPSSTTEPARRSRSRSRTAPSRRRRCGSSIPTCACTTRPSCRRRPCASAITELDGEAGILRYRGYPIEQLAEQSTYLEVAYLLHPRRAARPPQQFEQWTHDITYHTFIHENVRKRFMEGFHHDAHPMGMLVSGRRRAVDLLPRGQGHLRPRQPRQADRPADRQDADARRRRPPLQRRHAVRLPGQQPRLLRATSCR